MGDEQGVLIQLDPMQAVEQELTRIVRLAEHTPSYQDRTMRAYSYKIMREAFPELINRDRWRAMVGQDPDVSMDAQQADEDRALLRRHGRAICCPACDRDNAQRLRQELGLPAPVAPAQPVFVPEDEDEETECDHGDGDYIQCTHCDGRQDEHCDHRFACPNCENCDYEHSCEYCGLEPDCRHEWQCTECDGTP